MKFRVFATKTYQNYSMGSQHPIVGTDKMCPEKRPFSRN